MKVEEKSILDKIFELVDEIKRNYKYIEITYIYIYIEITNIFF